MRVTTGGILKGHTVELEDETTLPDGAHVQVTLETTVPSLEQKRQLVEELCGAWSSDESLAHVFQQLEQDRQKVIPRQRDDDVAS